MIPCPLEAFRYTRRRSSLELSRSRVHPTQIQANSGNPIILLATMQDKILLTYILADLLFLVSGALLIIFALTTKASNTSTPTVNSVANELLLDTCPLNGQSRFLTLINASTNGKSSGYRQCSLDLRDFLTLGPSYGFTNNERMAQTQRILDCRLRALHLDHRSDDLVRDPQGEKSSLRRLGFHPRLHTESATRESRRPILHPWSCSLLMTSSSSAAAMLIAPHPPSSSMTCAPTPKSQQHK